MLIAFINSSFRQVECFTYNYISHNSFLATCLFYKERCIVYGMFLNIKSYFNFNYVWPLNPFHAGNSTWCSWTMNLPQMYQRKLSSIFSRNALEFLENPQEIFPWTLESMDIVMTISCMQRVNFHISLLFFSTCCCVCTHHCFIFIGCFSVNHFHNITSINEE